MMSARKTNTLCWALTIAGLLSITLTTADAVAEFKDPAPWIGEQLDGKPCKNSRPPPGGIPYNYLDRPAIDGTLHLVENAHFHESVENLEKGATGSVMADIDFVLRAFPNHHRALNSSVRYSMKIKKWPEGDNGLPAECYLQRAIKFAPGDSVPMELYGYYMLKKGREEDALEAYKRALKLRPKDVMLNYNTALIMARAGEYKSAMKIARPLYDAGLTLPGLKNKLLEAGKWEYSEEELAQLSTATEGLTEDASADADDSDTAQTADDGEEVAEAATKKSKKKNKKSKKSENKSAKSNKQADKSGNDETAGDEAADAEEPRQAAL